MIPWSRARSPRACGPEARRPGATDAGARFRLEFDHSFHNYQKAVCPFATVFYYYSSNNI